VHSANGDSGDSNTREHMSANLEKAHGYGITQNSPIRATHVCKPYERTHKKNAVQGYECKLDESKSDGVAKLIQDRFAGV
jgi:hypothetical protein